jgi:acyl-homoserine-lactone acylase
MKPLPLILAALCATTASAQVARWQQQAHTVTITRDDWGIAHIRGKTDADAVFGMVYAQAEDDFNRVETNYIEAMGRAAEVEGEAAIFRDLRMKLFVDPDSLKAEYAASPAWLKSLMDAFADGLNYYLYTHPHTVPKLIKHFEPWMALAFSEGSIGGDIEHVSVRQLAAFYGSDSLPRLPATADAAPFEPTGSNGIAIGPAITATHHAMLLINPHTSFYFRSELQMASDEGLDAYGAVTWGQFFVYQGFNSHVGWMHTTSGVNDVSEYAETVVKKGNTLFYRYGKELRPLVVSTIIVPYKTATGMTERRFTVYRTMHGPIVREADGKWISVRMMQEHVKALTQSFLRTKATDYQSYRQTMELHTNSSNNTIFADANGDIAYFHANFIPRRDDRFDWTKPVDGSNPATDWKGLLSIDESPHLLNPANGWLYNSNNWPWSAAGPNSPKREDYPQYVETGTSETGRGLHATRLLTHARNVTLDSLMALAYDSYLPAFQILIPSLVKAWDSRPAQDSLKTKTAEQIAVLRAWDDRWSATSVPTTLAVMWGEEMGGRMGRGTGEATVGYYERVANQATPEIELQALATITDRLVADFGTWKTPWGQINRFQRINDEILPQFDDAAPSIPVAFTSAQWGSLASFGARAYPNTKKRYGSYGNSFVAVIEFGDSVRAKAVTAGGESGDPSSPHFDDEAQRYSTGSLRDVYYYRSQLKGHTEREYHPGDVTSATVAPTRTRGSTR